MHFTLLTFGALVASVIAAPSSTHVQHEKRDALPFGWERHDKLPSHDVLPMRIGLKQSNLDRAEEFLMEVSHPKSPKYGQHWSAKEVAETFAPSQESFDTVIVWLKSSGIAPERISRSQSMGWLTFTATVAEVEHLLKTEFFLHKHTTGKPHVGCDDYSVPEYVQPHIDIITPTVHFDTKVSQSRHTEKREMPLEKRSTDTIAAAGVPIESKAAVHKITDPNGGYLPKKGADIDIQSIITELEDCDEFIVPDCLRALYRFPPNVAANSENSFGYVNLLCGHIDITLIRRLPQHRRIHTTSLSSGRFGPLLFQLLQRPSSNDSYFRFHRWRRRPDDESKFFLQRRVGSRS